LPVVALENEMRKNWYAVSEPDQSDWSAKRIASFAQYKSQQRDTPEAVLSIKARDIEVAVYPEANAAQAIPSLEDAIRSLDGVKEVSTRVFVPVYLTDGLNVPTGTGFYVHREERYANEHVDEAIRLSREAWQTWEPTWGVRVTGLFREVPGEPDSVNLNRIVWYPSYYVWLETRNFQKDPESARRFRERRQLLIEGFGIAIATDRWVP